VRHPHPGGQHYDSEGKHSDPDRRVTNRDASALLAEEIVASRDGDLSHPYGSLYHLDGDLSHQDGDGPHLHGSLSQRDEKAFDLERTLPIRMGASPSRMGMSPIPLGMFSIGIVVLPLDGSLGSLDLPLRYCSGVDGGRTKD